MVSKSINTLLDQNSSPPLIQIQCDIHVLKQVIVANLCKFKCGLCFCDLVKIY